MDNITKVSVSTKADAKAEAVRTNLTLDWEGCSPEDIRALAQQALVVKLQGNWRRNGIPTDTTVKVSDHKVGTRAPKSAPDVLATIQKMSPEDRARIIAALRDGASA